MKKWMYFLLFSVLIIVGFAAIDYEEEYSFVIDLTWEKTDETWKIIDMDINK